MPAPKLTFVPYLQSWQPASRTLSLRVLVAPTGNPLKPLLAAPPGLPAFADAELSFRVFVSDAVGALPMRTNVDQTVDTPRRGAPDARAIFEAIKDALDIPDGPSGDTFAAQAPDTTKQLRKYLPKSYRQAFDFVQPRTSLALVDDTYRCLMQCPPKDVPPLPPTEIGWGEAIAFSLRRPRLAEALGLIVPIDIRIDAAPRLQNGGWLWVELSASSDYAAQAGTAGFQRAFATRIPALSDSETRPIFTPVVFPVSDNPAAAGALGQTDRVFAEAIRFDDGFSKIVHVRQPQGMDMLDEDGSSEGAARDEGIQLAWDDEDILEGQNRALGASPDGQNNVVAPRGTFGYRVDVRPAGTADWTSLSRVQSPADLGVDLGTAVEERWLEVHPNEVEDQLWLPPWFAIWRGGSVVMETQDEQRLMNAPPPPAGSPPETDLPVDLNGISLRYGNRYEFRVRLADATGGGPALGDDSLREGEAPIALLHMKRHVPPRRPILAPAAVPSDGALPSVAVTRPPLGFPAAVFAAGPAAQADLLAQIAANDLDPANATPPAIRDPDTVNLRIRVLLRSPTYDPGAGRQGWTAWYTTTRRFPVDPTQALTLSFDWLNAADYRDVDISAQLGAEGAVSGAIPLVRSRDIRIELAAIGRNDLSYFATDKARIGDIDSIELHAIAATEADPIALLPDQDKLRSVLLRDDPVGVRAAVSATVAQNDPSTVLVDRLALAADLVADDAMLLGREGERVAFGCAGLTHHAAPDMSSLEFAEPGELAGQWINVCQMVIDRDWTWRGQGAPTVRVRRRIALPGAPGDAPQWAEVGQIQLMNTINIQARKNPERGYIRMIFVDAFPPPIGKDGLPYEATVDYEMRLSFEGGTRASQTVQTLLPVATRPVQVPKVRAAGIALTPYAASADYSSTAPRVKRLWLEFDEPLADPRDAYFVRALYRTPDPMLLPGWEPVRDPDVLERVPLDPELARVITPGQVQDLSGLNAMQRLEPAGNSNRHFLVPLPPNTDPNSPELFSFYTYEIRVGHGLGTPTDPFWSTAQGRYGEALTLEGAQHPAPQLVCSVVAGPGRAIVARAPFATPYLGLKQVTPFRPNTEIWFVLYARLLQADGASHRNVQIDLRPSRPVKPGKSAAMAPQAEGRWSDPQVRDALARAGLDEDTPLTVLAVETLPEPNGSFSDPLGGDLGQVRVIRTSPLSDVLERCCIEI
ncbi:MAG: hypothetical protein H4O13_05800 [Xanthomonadales bacterium]|nr:hypothetical protein [Xanthomonadales bacterium]